MTQRHRLYIACAIALAGLIVAGRALWPDRGPSDLNVHVPPSESVDALLAPSVLDTKPTEETVSSIVDEAASSVDRQLTEGPDHHILNPSQARDLTDAFKERLEALLNPNLDRDFPAMVQRGDPRDRKQAAESFENNRSGHEWYRLTSIGLEHVQVRILARRGRLITPNLMDEGFDMITTRRTKNRMPAPEDPVAAGWDVVEIVLPISAKPIRGEARGVILAGFRFAWSPKRRQWIPYENVIYADPNDIYPALPL